MKTRTEKKNCEQEEIENVVNVVKQELCHEIFQNSNSGNYHQIE